MSSYLLCQLFQPPDSQSRTTKFIYIFRKAELENFFLSKRQSRPKVSQQSVNMIVRDLPNPEKSQNMIYAVSVKIIGHMPETPPPPVIVILLHFVPIIGRKSPILPMTCKSIGRRPRLSVKMEQFGNSLSRNTVASDSDGYVSFQYHSQFTGMLMRRLHLPMEQELNERIELSTLVLTLPIFLFNTGCRTFTKTRIGSQPIFIFLTKIPEGFRFQYLTCAFFIQIV